MEFNKPTETPSVSTSTDLSTEKVKLTSVERSTIKPINGTLKVDTKPLDDGSVKVSHNAKEITSSMDKDAIKRSLVNIYGKDGKLFSSSRDIESVNIPLSQYPAKLEYEFLAIQDGKEVEYKSSITLPITEKTILSSPTGKTSSSVSEMTMSEGIVNLDKEIVNIKQNLDDFYFIYDDSQKKSLPLHQHINNLSTKIDNLLKDINDIKTKIKDL
jgi:hypothetical protein